MAHTTTPTATTTTTSVRRTVISKVFGLDVSDNDIFHNLYISETYIFCRL